MKEMDEEREKRKGRGKDCRGKEIRMKEKGGG